MKPEPMGESVLFVLILMKVHQSEIQLEMWPPTLSIWVLLPILLSPSVFCYISVNNLSNVKIPELNKQQNAILLSSGSEQGMTNDEDAGEFLINTNQCLIQRHPVFDKDTIKLYKRFPNLNAGNQKCYRKASGIERLNFTWIRIPQPLLDIDCSVIRIDRDATNDGVKYGERINNLSTTLIEFPDWDAALVECGKEQEIVALIADKVPFNYSDLLKPKIHNKKPINVLVLGIDSVSRLNFKRHFIQTDAFLKQTGFQSFYGHHKVGDNTQPNVFPMLLGEHMDTSLAWLNRTSMDTLDPLPFIQKYYSNAGYLTTFIEDLAYSGIFNYSLAQHMGHQLTEYNTRPASLEMVRRNLLYQYIDIISMCYQNRFEIEYLYDYLLDLIRRHQVRGYAHFSWLHSSTLSHNGLNLCQYLDQPLHRFLSAFFKQSLHQNTIIILYSDHAIRNEAIVYTDSGFHEARLPVLYIYIPEHVQLMDENDQWLNTDDLRKILATNAHSLTSHIDIHATLRHILTGNPPSLSGSNVSDAEPYGKSLFTPISSERTCDDAGIPPEWCFCAYYEPFENKKLAASIAKEIVRHINQKILALPMFENRCQQHEFTRMLQAKVMELRGRNQLMLFLIFSTSNGAEFEAHIKLLHSIETSTIPIEIVGQITRADSYAEQSFCVRHLNRLERFCVCK